MYPGGRGRGDDGQQGKVEHDNVTFLHLLELNFTGRCREDYGSMVQVVFIVLHPLVFLTFFPIPFYTHTFFL